MASEHIVVGLDVGTQFVRTVVGQRVEDEPEPLILGVGLTPSAGLRRGIVVDVEETVKAITAAIEEAERISGVSVGNAFVNISGNHIESQNSRGVVAVSRADSEIGAEDVARAIEAAKAVAVPANKEIIHVLPREYIVDGQEGIKDPIGMNGIRLEVEAHVISAASPQIKNVTKCVYQSGVEVDDLVFSGLTSSRGVLSRRQKELGVIQLDIGAGVTDLTIYEEGDVLHSAVIPVGGSHLTNDLAIGLRTDTDIAERVKLEYGSAVPKDIKSKESVDLASLARGDEHQVSKKLIAEIIEARIAEILALVQKELKKIDRDGKLPAGVVLTGGTAKLPGLVDATKNILGLPAQVGFPSELKGMAEKIDDPSFATSIGLMLWGFDQGESNRTSKRFGNLPGSQYLDKVRGVVKQFLP
ncbi:cell division protein FtsA [Patescibacteria group bacterium]|nr:cell division protein FtsA [Patescibacteria group bacterium]